MKIVHLCLCGPMTDGLTYQENLLTKFHKELGHEVSIVASRYMYEKGKVSIDNRNRYYNSDGVKVIRLDNKFNTNINSKLKIYKGLYNSVDQENPDLIFVHGVQFLDILTIKRYIKNNPRVKLIIDNHADFSNSATNFISKFILHKILWKFMAKLISPYTVKFLGVLPARVEFLQKLYSIPENKTELLLMGADDNLVIKYSSSKVRDNIRKKLGISLNDFVIITGGKIDKAKQQVLTLMKAVNDLNNKDVKLIIFGSIDSDIEDKFFKLANNVSIINVGWVNEEDSYQLFSISDLAVFPGRHSVYWEQVAGIGKPMIVKYWKGTTHIDLGRNVLYLKDDSLVEMKKVLAKVINNDEIYSDMLTSATSNESKKFLYSNIAVQSLKYCKSEVNNE
ncbi:MULTISPECIES: glycosyltransferase [Aerococcus]|uniref:Glycosyltransferase n=4 Tax=Aerococcus TaxID=1375 RepID=A0A2I1L4W9_9LACT|nr:MULTISPECIES: glycosyltransferase [Aerococcus]KAA9218297.1 glycosyltransferase family 4 protein [Aerococcus loyolae]MCY3026443.1 glycosyltransferase [Aerococcus loyolae]MCY3027880.1 glycosyltransferase [Aerococcus loyolae]MDK6258645.1 glycosyltransferase [Aerococcus urinae]MDK6294489.1 glycosyltransferase [Aerococcus urinae]